MSRRRIVARPETRAKVLEQLRARRDALDRGRWGSMEESRLYQSGQHRVADELRKVEERIAIIEALR